jgi:hypothetical protein
MSKPFKFREKWWIRSTDEFGKRRKRVFDSYADTDHALTAEKARVREVKLGLRSPTPPAKTFNELADYWLQNQASQKRSGFHDVSIIRAHLRPSFEGPAHATWCTAAVASLAARHGWAPTSAFVVKDSALNCRRHGRRSGGAPRHLKSSKIRSERDSSRR